MEPETIVTQAGFDKLQQELDQLVTVRRPDIAARIKEARELGDLKENADYHAAKDDQGFLETKIMQLEAKIRTARIVEKADGKKVGVGSKVTVIESETGETEVYTVTGAVEADPFENKISYDSPIGQALFGATTGDLITVTLPNGSIEFKIKSVTAT